MHAQDCLRRMDFGALRDDRVIGAAQSFMVNCVCFETRLAEQDGAFSRKVLVDLESQALISRGKSTVPSRVSSAA